MSNLFAVWAPFLSAGQAATWFQVGTVDFTCACKDRIFFDNHIRQDRTRSYTPYGSFGIVSPLQIALWRRKIHSFLMCRWTYLHNQTQFHSTLNTPFKARHTHWKSCYPVFRVTIPTTTAIPTILALQQHPRH